MDQNKRIRDSICNIIISNIKNDKKKEFISAYISDIFNISNDIDELFEYYQKEMAFQLYCHHVTNVKEINIYNELFEKGIIKDSKEMVLKAIIKYTITKNIFNSYISNFIQDREFQETLSWEELHKVCNENSSLNLLNTFINLII